jgi:hypothetical protein
MVQTVEVANRRLTRNLLAASCIGLPLLFYFVIFPLSRWQVVWDGQSLAKFGFAEDGYCITGVDTPGILVDVLRAIRRVERLIEVHPAAAEAVVKFRIAELAGRLDFLLPSILLRTVAVISFIVSCYIIWRSMRLERSRLIIAIALIILGCFVGYAMDHAPGTRLLLMDQILLAEPAPLILKKPALPDKKEPAAPAKTETAQPTKDDEFTVSSSDPPWSPSKNRLAVDAAITVNLYLGAIAILAILAGLAAVTAGHNVDSRRAVRFKARELRERMGFLKTLIGLEVAIFILLILITMTATDWATGLVCHPERDALTQISTTLKYYWGVSATGVIVCSLLPAYYSWRGDVSRYVESLASSTSFKEAKTAVEDEGLTFTPTQTILSLLTVALPALTTPLIDTMHSLLP